MRARAATTVVFFATGAIFASWGARIPAVQERLDLSTGELAIAILGIEGGAVLGLPAGGVLTARIGSRRTLRIGFMSYAAAMTAVGLAPGLATLTGALALTAAATSLNDVSGSRPTSPASPRSVCWRAWRPLLRSSTSRTATARGCWRGRAGRSPAWPRSPSAPS